MYKSFEIKNFRCFEDFKIDDLQRINLITGKNNVGKTALLEALFLYSGERNPQLTQLLQGLRDMPTTSPKGPGSFWDSIYRNFDTVQPIELIGDSSKYGHRVQKLR